MRSAKGAHVNETPGKRDCQSSKECSVALQHTNMGVPEALNSLSAQNQDSKYNQDTNTVTRYFSDLTYATEHPETEILTCLIVQKIIANRQQERLPLVLYY